MQYGVPSSPFSHAVSFAGAVAVHASLALWAMMPSAPIAIPQQQVIQVSMVAPTSVKQEPTPEVVEVKKEIPKTPPKEKGMVKKELPKPVQTAKKEPKPEAPQQVVRAEAQTQLTTGMQSAEAMQQNSAVTEPVAANYLNNPPPSYPPSARMRKEQGTVLIDVRVTAQGTPGTVSVERSSGHESLDEAALDAVKRWRFVPARRGSEVVEASVIVPIQFRIN